MLCLTASAYLALPFVGFAGVDPLVAAFELRSPYSAPQRASHLADIKSWMVLLTISRNASGGASSSLLRSMPKKSMLELGVGHRLSSFRLVRSPEDARGPLPFFAPPPSCRPSSRAPATASPPSPSTTSVDANTARWTERVSSNRCRCRVAATTRWIREVSKLGRTMKAHYWQRAMGNWSQCLSGTCRQICSHQHRVGPRGGGDCHPM